MAGVHATIIPVDRILCFDIIQALEKDLEMLFQGIPLCGVCIWYLF